jgi:WD40 repeat protein
MPGHTQGVTCLARLSDDVIVSGSYDGTARIWDLKSRSARFPLLMNFGCVHSVAKISHSNVATGSTLGAIHVFSFLTGEMLFLNEEAHSEDIMALASMENGKFASGSYDKTIKVWSAETGECLLILKQDNPVCSLAPLANDLLAVSVHFGTCVWDLSKKSIVKKLASAEGLSCTSHHFVRMSGLLFLCDHASPSVALGLCADTYEDKHRFVFTGRAEAAAALPNECLILANAGSFTIYQ